MGINDTWHKTDARPGEPVCRQHGKVPTQKHGKGKRWEVRREGYRGFFDKISEARKADKEIPTIATQEPVAVEEERPTFDQFCWDWFRTYSADPKTRTNAYQALKLHIIPYTQGKDLRLICDDIMFWREWMAILVNSKKPNTVAHIYGVAKQIITVAEKQRLVTFNPLSLIAPPSGAGPKQIYPWPVEWVLKMKEHLPEPYKIIVDLGALGGLRPSEIGGISAADILDGHIIIRRQVQRHGRVLYYKLPKYQKTRMIPVPQELIERINAHIANHGTHAISLPHMQEKETQTHPLLLASSKGSPLYNAVFSNIWNSAKRSAGIPNGRENGGHALRHFCASLAIYNGADLKSISKYLGHSSVAVTDKYYVHLMRQYGERMRIVLSGTL